MKLSKTLEADLKNEIKICAKCNQEFKLCKEDIGGFYTGALCPDCHNELVQPEAKKKTGGDTAATSPTLNTGRMSAFIREGCDTITALKKSNHERQCLINKYVFDLIDKEEEIVVLKRRVERLYAILNIVDA